MGNGTAGRTAKGTQRATRSIPAEKISALIERIVYWLIMTMMFYGLPIGMFLHWLIVGY